MVHNCIMIYRWRQCFAAHHSTHHTDIFTHFNALFASGHFTRFSRFSQVALNSAAGQIKFGHSKKEQFLKQNTIELVSSNFKGWGRGGDVNAPLAPPRPPSNAGNVLKTRRHAMRIQSLTRLIHSAEIFIFCYKKCFKRKYTCLIFTCHRYILSIPFYFGSIVIVENILTSYVFHFEEFVINKYFFSLKSKD